MKVQLTYPRSQVYQGKLNILMEGKSVSTNAMTVAKTREEENTPNIMVSLHE